jgi:hypothetical protein
VYIDPNAEPPSVENPASTTVGGIGSSLSDLEAAANSGALRVDPDTGDATIRALTEVEHSVELYWRRLANTMASGTRLGGGYAQQIDQFNHEWTASGPDSAMQIMSKYVAELRRLKEAVRKSMATYQHTDAENAQRVTDAGERR